MLPKQHYFLKNFSVTLIYISIEFWTFDSRMGVLLVKAISLLICLGINCEFIFYKLRYHKLIIVLKRILIISTSCEKTLHAKRLENPNTNHRTIPCRGKLLLRHLLVVEKKLFITQYRTIYFFFHDILNNVILMFFKSINIRWIKNTGQLTAPC